MNSITLTGRMSDRGLAHTQQVLEYAQQLLERKMARHQAYKQRRNGQRRVDRWLVQWHLTLPLLVEYLWNDLQTWMAAHGWRLEPTVPRDTAEFLQDIYDVGRTRFKTLLEANKWTIDGFISHRQLAFRKIMRLQGCSESRIEPDEE